MYQKFFCMLGFHDKKWELYNTVKIVSGDKDQYISGYKHYYKATCTGCGHTEHKMNRV